MKKRKFTHLGHTPDDLEYVQFVMKEIVNGTKIDEIKRKFVEENPLGIKTESTRKGYINWIISGYVKGFKQKELEIFAKVISDERVHPQTKKEIMFWKNCRSDDLVRKITLDFTFKKFHNAKYFERKELFNFVSQEVSNPSTANKHVSGYLALLRGMGVISSEKNFHEFRFYRPNIESMIFLLFHLLNSKQTPSQILKADDFKYLLVSERELISMLKEIQFRGLISFAMSGDIIKLEPKIEFEAVPNAIRS